MLLKSVLGCMRILNRTLMCKRQVAVFLVYSLHFCYYIGRQFWDVQRVSRRTPLLCSQWRTSAPNIFGLCVYVRCTCWERNSHKTTKANYADSWLYLLHLAEPHCIYTACSIAFPTAISISWASRPAHKILMSRDSMLCLLTLHAPSAVVSISQWRKPLTSPLRMRVV